MEDNASIAADGESDDKPIVVPADAPQENPKPLPDDPNNDEDSPLPRPLAPELLPIGDPAGAA